MPRSVSRGFFNSEVSLLDEFENREEDEELLEELAEKRKQRQKSFLAVVNKKKLSKFELDDVML